MTTTKPIPAAMPPDYDALHAALQRHCEVMRVEYERLMDELRRHRLLTPAHEMARFAATVTYAAYEAAYAARTRARNAREME